MKTARNPKSKTKGFTMIELLIVIALIGILAGIMATVLKTQKYLGDSRNAKRRLELHTISMAVYQYTVGHGTMPSGITEIKTEICNQDAADCTGYVDLSELLNQTEFLTAIPEDPKNDDENGTGYSIYRTQFGRVVVSADLAENGEVLEVTR